MPHWEFPVFLTINQLAHTYIHPWNSSQFSMFKSHPFWLLCSINHYPFNFQFQLKIHTHKWKFYIYYYFGKLMETQLKWNMHTHTHERTNTFPVRICALHKISINPHFYNSQGADKLQSVWLHSCSEHYYLYMYWLFFSFSIYVISSFFYLPEKFSFCFNLKVLGAMVRCKNHFVIYFRKPMLLQGNPSFSNIYGSWNNSSFICIPATFTYNKCVVLWTKMIADILYIHIYYVVWVRDIHSKSKKMDKEKNITNFFKS